MKKNAYKLLLSSLLVLSFMESMFSQSVPSKVENIPYLVTFGKQSDKSWGDDDFSQSWFFIVPKEVTRPFYIRIFDPDVCGTIDELKGACDSKTRFSVYGGKGTFTHPDAVNLDPTGNYKSGTLLFNKTFGNNPEYDGKWFSLGPFNPGEGEFVEEYNGYVFKLIADGEDGNDGNLYKYFMSTSSAENIPIEGGNVFTFEYTFRIFEEKGSVSHIYPYVTPDVIAVNIHSFDLDDDSYMRIVSVSKKGEKITGSSDNEWSVSNHPIKDEEKKTSLDIQIIKLKEKVNNNLVISITNQYGRSMPFFTVPIGGIPKYKYKIGIKQ